MADDENESPPPRMFTQDEVNRIAASARAERRAGAAPAAAPASAPSAAPAIDYGALAAAIAAQQAAAAPRPAPAAAPSAPNGSHLLPTANGLVDPFSLAPHEIRAVGSKGIRRLLEQAIEHGNSSAGNPTRPRPPRKD